jgi:rare lipoprotein A
MLACALTVGITKRALAADEGAVGYASFYAAVPKFDNLTAAHRHLPFGTRVRVTRLDTQKHVIVRINDRGPFIKGRIIDLSHRAAEQLGMINAGVTRVRVEVIDEVAKPDAKAGGVQPASGAWRALVTKMPE